MVPAGSRAWQAKLPAAARVLPADPAAVTVEDGHPLASHSGLGLTPFYYALILVVCGMLSANVISGQVVFSSSARTTGPRTPMGTLVTVGAAAAPA
ncbi:hypothetical protein [Streptomyces cynarae]|uniref:hypothetical protein n=1 Tax=Streptomyces cynarae TaxID=2981134 RepID=UPI0036F41BBF